MGKVVLCVFLAVVVSVVAVPVADTLASMDLSLTVFDQHSVSKADASKNYVIFAFDNDSCTGDKSAKCAALEQALNEVKTLALQDSFAKYRAHVSFGKANKDDFPEHKQDFEKAKVPLPAVLFWPAGHSRPSCKYSADKAQGGELFAWLQGKLKEEDDDDLLQVDEGAELEVAKVDPAVLVCQADGGPNPLPPALSSDCGDLLPSSAELLQLAKSQRIWDSASGSLSFVGPADNSLPHTLGAGSGGGGGGGWSVRVVDAAAFRDTAKLGVYQALYFTAPWCTYCSCLAPVWDAVNEGLVASTRQPDLVVETVDGDVSSDLRDLLNVTAYPTFVLVNKEGTAVLGRYLGARKAFDLSTWIQDLIVADNNPIVKTQFDVQSQGAVSDAGPVFPYQGAPAFPQQ